MVHRVFWTCLSKSESSRDTLTSQLKGHPMRKNNSSSMREHQSSEFVVNSPLSLKCAKTIPNSVFHPSIMDFENLRKLGEEFTARVSKEKEQKKKADEEAEPRSLRLLKPTEVQAYTIKIGKYKGKPLEKLYQDHDYVKWILQHTTDPEKTRSFEMSKVLILLELRMTMDQKGKVAPEEAKPETGSAGYRSGASKPVSSKEMPTSHLDPKADSVSMDEEDMKESAQLGRTEALEIGQEALQQEVKGMNQRMDRIEGALATIIGQLQKSR